MPTSRTRPCECKTGLGNNGAGNNRDTHYNGNTADTPKTTGQTTALIVDPTVYVTAEHSVTITLDSDIQLQYNLGLDSVVTIASLPSSQSQYTVKQLRWSKKLSNC